MALLQREKRNFPATTIAQIRNLYVVKGLGPSDIATRLGMTRSQVSMMANRYEWVEERRKRIERLSSQLEARAHDEDAGFLASMAVQSEELAEDSMNSARLAASQGIGATRELQQASQSAKNFVDIYFKSRRLDTQQGAVVNIGSLYCSLTSQATPQPEKNVTPAVLTLPSN